MSASNVQTTLSGISILNPIKSLVMYSQGTLPVYLFIGDSAGGLYIYDMSYGTQNSFSVSGTTTTGGFTGLAVTDQYLFANTPGNCYQIPLYQFYGTTSTVINTLSAVSVANCYTRDSKNTGGIAVTPGGESLFLVTGDSNVTKVSISDTGNGAAKQFVSTLTTLDPEFYGIALDSVDKKLYMTDVRSRRIFTCGYSKSNAVISNIYLQFYTNDIPYQIAYSTQAGTFAYSTVNLNQASSVRTYNPVTAFSYDLIPLDSPTRLKESYAVAYDAVGSVYVSTKSNNVYTVVQSSYSYTPRPQPSVAPPKQIPVECGLILPGSCKQTWHPFNPRERFSLGSPYRPYQIIDPSAKISCPPSFVSDACPGFSERPSITPSAPPVVQQQVIRPPTSSASTQQISRSRNLATTRISSLNLVSSLPILYTNDIVAPPALGPDGSIYITTVDGVVFRAKGSTITSNAFPGLTFSTAPAISQTDGQLAFGSDQGTLLVTDASLNRVWSIAGGASTTPSYVGGNIFVAKGASLVARAGSNGSVVWSAPELPYPDTYASSTNVELGNVLVGTTNGVLYVYDQYTGSNVFYVPIGTGPIRGSPNIDIDNFVNVGSGSNLFQINMDRTQSATDSAFTSVNGNIVTPIVVAVDLSTNVRTFFTTDAGYAYSVDAVSYIYQNASGIETNCIPVLDISSMYVVKSGSINKYRWNMWPNPTTSTALTQTGTYAPANTVFVGSSTLINASNQIVVLSRNIAPSSSPTWIYTPVTGEQIGPFSLINGYLYFGGSSGNYYVKRASGAGATSIYTLSYPVTPTASVLVGGNVWFTNGNILYSKPQGGGGSPQNIYEYGNSGEISPLSADGISLLFGATDASFVKYNTDTTNIATLVTVINPTLTSITIVEGVYTFTDGNSTMYLADTRDPLGNMYTVDVKLGDGEYILTSPTYVGNSTYVVGSADGNIYWVQATNSTGQYDGWSLTVLSSNYTGAPIGLNRTIAVQDGIAYVCPNTSAVYAFDTATRTQLWVNSDITATCPPVAIYGSLYVGTSSRIYILRATDGALLKTLGVTNVTYIAVSSTDGSIYATTPTSILRFESPFPYSILTLA